MAMGAFVLVVDDDPAVLALVSAVLETAGYRVTTATDAWQEVVQAQGLKIGLVISDIQMPGAGTGVDAVNKLRTLPGVSPLLPVVFMTGMPPEDARKLIPSDPNIRLISKPIDFERLRVAIKELTGVDRPL
jgi:two-component system chemotaxis response regulator CheY